MFLYHLTRHPTRDLTINTQHPTPNTHHPTPNTHHPVTINTQHPSPSNHQHPSPNTQHPDGEVVGEVSGGVFAKHLTIQTPQQQRASGRFGEVFSVCSRKIPIAGGEPAQGSSHLRIEKKGHYALPAGRNDIFLNILSESFGDLGIIDYLCRTENTCRNRTCTRWKR